MSKYHVTIEGDETIASATGSLKLAGAAVKEGLAAIKGQPGEFVAAFVELTDGGEREVVRVKATEDIVTLVVRKRLADERKQEAGSTAEATGQTGEPNTPDTDAFDA